MLRRFTFLLLSFFFLIPTACTGSGLSSPTIIGPTVTPNPNASPSLTPFSPSENTPTVPNAVPTIPATSTSASTLTPTSTQIPAPVSVPSLYTLSVILDYAAHSLSVDESILYQNATGGILPSIVLAVEPNLWAGCFALDSLTVNGQAVTGMSLKGDRLEVPLAALLVPGGTLNLSMHFDLHLPPADVHHVFGYNERQTNLVDWYPFIVPYSQDWLLHPPAEVGEHLAYDAAVFDVTVTLADPTQPVTLAASAPAEAVAAGWHYRLQNARTFVFSASTAYQTVSATASGVTVTSYYFREEEIQARTVLDEVAKALTTFGTLFSPCPYPSLSIVESPYFDGMEYDGLFFLSRDYYITKDATVLNNLIDIAVHETAHQWWFGSVGNDQALEPWLDEALATYSEKLFYEKNYPAVTAWWSFRVNAYAPTGWVDTDIYHGGNFRSYANAVYLRGAQFLEALRGRIGDEAFFGFLKDYAAQMSGKRATADDFFRILRTHTSLNISDLITDFFQKPR